MKKRAQTAEEIQSLRSVLARQEREIEQLRVELRRLGSLNKQEQGESSAGPRRLSRAGLLKVAVGGAAGIATAGLALNDQSGTARAAFGPSLATVFEGVGNGGTSGSPSGTAFATDTNNGQDSAFYDIGVDITAGSSAFVGKANKADCVIGTTNAFYKSGVVGYGQPSGSGGVGTGVYGQAGQGVFGYGVDGFVPNEGAVSGIGVIGVSTGNFSGAGVMGLIDGLAVPDFARLGLGGTAIYAAASSSKGVHAISDSNVAVDASSNSNTAIVAKTGTGAYGLQAISGMGIGVLGQLSGSATAPVNAGVGVYGSGAGPGGGSPLGKIGVQGVSDTNFGVFGTSPGGPGVRGSSTNSFGVYGTSTTSVAVKGVSTSNYGGVFASTQGSGAIAEQTGPLTGNTTQACFNVIRNGTNASGNSFSYSGALIYGNDGPARGSGSIPQSTGPLLQLDRNGVNKLKVDGSGNLTLGGTLTLMTATSTSASGGNLTPPSQVAGYLEFTIAGVQHKVPYYNV